MTAAVTENDGFTVSAYGAAVRFETGDRELLRELREDFSALLGEAGPAQVRISAEVAAPPAPPERARRMFCTRKWTAYALGGRRLVFYPEGALCEYDYAAAAGRVTAAGRELARELSYLLVLSRLGERLDLLGLHRLHAMAGSFGGTVFAAAAPPGAGKTTLLLSLSRLPGFEPLANDTPLVDREGRIYPFPLRAGIGEDSPFRGEFQPGELRRFVRRHYPPKLLLPPGPTPELRPRPCGALFLLRHGDGKPRITPASGAAAAAELLRSMVIGWGVPQLAEFSLRADAGDIRAKAGTAFSRARAALALLSRCGLFFLNLSPDPAANAAALADFLAGIRSGKRPGGNII